MATRSKNQNDLDGTSHLLIMHGIDDTGYVYAAGVYKPSIYRGKNCVNLSCTAVRGGGGGGLIEVNVLCECILPPKKERLSATFGC